MARSDCQHCAGAGWAPYAGGMVRCGLCAPEPERLSCRSEGGCLEPFRCNVAGRCSMPAPSPRRVVEAMHVGEEMTVPVEDAGRVRKAAYDCAARSGFERWFRSRSLGGRVILRRER